jgi:hypothetical protein
MQRSNSFNNIQMTDQNYNSSTTSCYTQQGNFNSFRQQPERYNSVNPYEMQQGNNYLGGVSHSHSYNKSYNSYEHQYQPSSSGCDNPYDWQPCDGGSGSYGVQQVNSGYSSTGSRMQSSYDIGYHSRQNHRQVSISYLFVCLLQQTF